MDLDPENTWVVSDTHFCHNNIVHFCNRPANHDDLMVENWISEVPDDATVLHLGDLCFFRNSGFHDSIAQKLTGSCKLLIKGNHDRQRNSFYAATGFKVVEPFWVYYGPVPRYRISFSHYAWGPDEPFQQTSYDVRLHGHIHNNGYDRKNFTPYLRGHINMSIEQTQYKPVNLKRLLDAYIYGERHARENDDKP